MGDQLPSSSGSFVPEHMDYLIEEVDSKNMLASELAQFRVTQPLEVVGILPAQRADSEAPSGSQDQGALLKFASGEGVLPDCYTNLDASEESSAESDNDRLSDGDYIITEEPCDDKRRPRLRKCSALTPHQRALMGEANLKLARGNVEMAKKMCLEIIRQNPVAAEPFITLSEIYDRTDQEKCLDFLTIAAHLDPHNRDQWIRIAELHIAKGDKAKARVFYSKALKANPKDYDLRLKKAHLLEEMGEVHNAMVTYLHSIRHVPVDQIDLCLGTAKKVARHFHNTERHHLALQAMNSAYAVCAHMFSSEDLNLYLELLMLNQKYQPMLEVLRERANLMLEFEQDTDMIIYCVIPDDMIPEFRAKLCIALIKLKALHLYDFIIDNVQHHIPVIPDRFELYVDIAEAFMAGKRYKEATELLKNIVHSKIVECPAIVWLRQAECLRQLERTSEAIQAYMKVVELAPLCYEAKFTLSALLKQQGRHAEAIQALEQVESGDEALNGRLLYERCLMLEQVGKIDEFLEVGSLLLGRHAFKVRSRAEMLIIANGANSYNPEGIKHILQIRNITDNTEKTLQELHQRALADESNLCVDDEYELFTKLVRAGYERKQYSLIEKMCFSVVTTKSLSCYASQLEPIIILSCYFNNNCSVAFSYLRELITKSRSNVMLWNLLNLFVQKGQHLRYFRYVRRLLHRFSCPREVKLFLAHFHLHGCSYKYALNIYVPLFKEQPDALLALCIAVVFNQLGLQKKVLRKTAAMGQAIAFAHKYAALRGGGADKPSTAQQEICYNMGRFYHQTGLLHLAIEYYERGLQARHELIEQNETFLGLRHEIAYNLHLIYRANGNMVKARQLLYEYCVV